MNMEEWKNDIMDSLEGMQKAQAPEHTYSSIKQRVKALRPPVFEKYLWAAAAVLALVVSFNVYVLQSYFSSDRSETSLETGGQIELVTDFNLYQL